MRIGIEDLRALGLPLAQRFVLNTSYGVQFTDNVEFGCLAVHDGLNWLVWARDNPRCTEHFERFHWRLPTDGEMIFLKMLVFPEVLYR